MEVPNQKIEEKVSEKGRVKWFNNKAGYGFITSANNEDIFVHHSAIKVKEEQYRYLIQGEYVEYNKTTLEKGGHSFQAENVKGISDGKLMCETRFEARNNRLQYKDSSKEDNNTSKNRKRGKNVRSKSPEKMQLKSD